MLVAAIEGLPDGVLGFEASGEVTGEDYETVLVPAVENALADADKVSLLYLLGDDFEGYSAAAMWDDTKVGMTHLFSWERLAVVTDHSGYAHTIKGFGFLIPAHVKVFATAELEEAKAWVAGG